MPNLSSESGLRRQLGLTAVAAIVIGDMLGSGIFFTPGELASIAERPWQIFFFWGLCGFITLCGALTLAELSAQFPRSGATYHIILEGYGPFWAFLKIWVEMWVGGPGSVAGIAIVLGQFLSSFFIHSISWSPAVWGVLAISSFTLINLLGVRWGGRTQIILTFIKITALIALVLGGLVFADPTGMMQSAVSESGNSFSGLLAFVKFVGLGVAAVVFTYDGWIDVTHVAGEVKNPQTNLARGLALGVSSITALYLLVNYAYLSIVPLQKMKEAPTLVASGVAISAFGPKGGDFITALIIISILGALGGLVMTLPRLFFAAASQYENQTRDKPRIHFFFRILSSVSSISAVPSGAICFSAVMSILALLYFQSFSRIVTFFVVPLQVVNILMVASIFRLRKRSDEKNLPYRTPGYPVLPLIYVIVMALFLTSAVYFKPLDTSIGLALTATAIPVYFWINKKGKK